MDKKIHEEKHDADKIRLYENEDKQTTPLNIGIDALPSSIRSSGLLNEKNLEQLAGVKNIPMVDPAFDDDRLKNIIQYFSADPEEMEKELHTYAKQLLTDGKVGEAWQVLLALI